MKAKTAVAGTKTAVSKAKTAVTETKTAVTETKTAVAATKTAVATRETAVTKTKTAVAKAETASTQSKDRLRAQGVAAVAPLPRCLPHNQAALRMASTTSLPFPPMRPEPSSESNAAPTPRPDGRLPQRPPLTVWRFVTLELWRLLLITAWVFVSVIAFAATVKPLADGELGPVDALTFMMLAMPPMLAYALPFASGFAATLAYHRMAQDNEVVACQAGGLSHRNILAPALISGIVLAIALFILSNSIIPRFLRSMEELVTVDATRLLMNTINRGEPVQFNDTIIHADYVWPETPPKDSQASHLLNLKGLLVITVDDNGRVRSEISAPWATAWIFRSQPSTTELADGEGRDEGRGGGGSETLVAIDLRNYSANGAELRGTQERAVYSLRVPNTFSDDPKFLTWRELDALRDHPARMNWVDERRRNLASRLAQRAVLEKLAAEFNETGALRLVSARDEDLEAWTVHAAGLGDFEPDRGHRLIPPAHAAQGADLPFFIERITSNGEPQTFRARQVWVDASPSPETPGHPVNITVTLSEYIANVEPFDGGQSSGALIRQTHFAGLVPHADPAPEVFSLSSQALLEQADDRVAANPADDFIDDARVELRRVVNRLMREISSKQQERLASSAACLVMVLTGAVMAMRLRERTPLTVYLWSFFPALAAVLTISAGQQTIHDYGLIALPIMWGGVLGLGAYTFVEFRRLARY